MTPALTTDVKHQSTPGASLERGGVENLIEEAIIDGHTDRANARRSWPFGLDDIQPALSRYSDEARLTLISAFRWCADRDHLIYFKDFAERVKCNENTLYKIFLAKYTNPETGELYQPKQKLLDAIENFLAIEKKRFALGETALVETPTLKSIETLCDLVRESQTIGFITGVSHIGKTTALEPYYSVKRNHGRTIYVRLPAAAGLRQVLSVICQAMGVGHRGEVEQLMINIKAGLTKDMLLILDEVHLLAHTYNPKTFFKVIEKIREIHDSKKVGLVLCFTILDAVTAAKTKELQQLWRRAIHKLVLHPMPTIPDLTAILEHNGLSFPDKELKVTVRFKSCDQDGKEKMDQVIEQPREILRQLAKDDGLKAISERIRYARDVAKKAGKKLDWAHFVQAHLIIAKQSAPKEGWV
jgi:DNA transposition AAA+ family ATPase